VAIWFGWVAVVLIALSASVPLAFRWSARKRAAPDSTPISIHVVLGLATVSVAFAHTIFVLPGLGSPEAVEGGLLAFLPGVAAFFLLIAHGGLGLQLRDVRLRERARKRRAHVTTAILIAVAVAAHVIPLVRATK
jgi:uncharacterized membrane protein YozB (DUF420 family)